MKELPQRPVRIEQLQFVEDHLVAAVLDGEGVAVPIRVVCDALGLDTEAQSQRLRDHDVLSQGLRIVRVPLNNRIRSVVAILHTHIAFWLASITPNLVAEAVRPKLIRYQEELVVVLNALYGPNLETIPTAAFDSGTVLESPAPMELVTTRRELVTLRAALLDLIQAQRQTTEQMALLSERVDGVADLVDELRTIAKIHPAQAEYLQRAIKRLALRVQQKTRSERNMYELLFGQFKISMGIPRYDALPIQQYDRAIQWLEAKAAELLPGDSDALPPMQEQLL